MPTITITKIDYDEVIYRAVAERPSATLTELRTAVTLLSKLEAIGASTGIDESGAELGYEMVAETTAVDLTDAEAVLLLDRMERDLQQRLTRRSRTLLTTIEPLSTSVEAVRAAERAAQLDEQTAALAAQEAQERAAQLADIRTEIQRQEAILSQLNARATALEATLPPPAGGTRE